MHYNHMYVCRFIWACVLHLCIHMCIHTHINIYVYVCTHIYRIFVFIIIFKQMQLVDVKLNSTISARWDLMRNNGDLMRNNEDFSKQGKNIKS